MTSESTRVVRLLDRGFYAVELPPPFKTQNFSNVRDTLVVPDSYSGSTTFYDGATFKGTLRQFGVINPLNYLLLSKFIAANWSGITSTYNLSKCSGSRPKFPKLSAPGRSIEAASIAAKRTAQHHLASAYPVILNLDINRFYGSIYTHSIPWSVLGKEEAKRRFHSGTLVNHWSAKADRLLRNCNQRQTIGIAIGPDTSRIISEMILSRLDNEICSKGSGLSSGQVFHNIDDYQFGAISQNEAEMAQTRFVRSISRYELRLNDFKTKIDGGVHFSPAIFQRHFDILSGKKGEKFIEHLFEILYAQIPRFPDANIIGYVLKRFAKPIANTNAKDLAREYLQRLLIAQPHQARWIFPLLLGFYKNTNVNAEIRRIIRWGCELLARKNDIGSLCWFLYAAIFLEIKIGALLCATCVGLSNELIDLMLFHGKSKGLFSIPLNKLRERYKDNKFNESAWLVLYEVERQGWDNSATFQKIGSADDVGALYAHLRQNSVSFYVADDDVFEVEAFSGWGLDQGEFAIEIAEPFDWDWLEPANAEWEFDESYL